MPPPPEVNILTRYVLENPWPLGLALLAVAIVMGWTAAREGRSRRLVIAIVIAVLALAVFAIAFAVTTSGERAKAITRQLVTAAAEEDVVAAMKLFAPEATIGLVSPTNPRQGVEVILAQLDRLATRYPIESNSITMLKGFSESSDAATAHLACWTQIEGSPYQTVTQWVVRVERQSDGTWKVADLTWVSMNGDQPTRWW